MEGGTKNPIIIRIKERPKKLTKKGIQRTRNSSATSAKSILPVCCWDHWETRLRRLGVLYVWKLKGSQSSLRSISTRTSYNKFERLVELIFWVSLTEVNEGDSAGFMGS